MSAAEDAKRAERKRLEEAGKALDEANDRILIAARMLRHVVMLRRSRAVVNAARRDLFAAVERSDLAAAAHRAAFFVVWPPRPTARPSEE